MKDLQDFRESLRASVIDAGKAGRKCIPTGERSKRVLDEVATTDLLSTRGLSRISDYAPTEFVVTAAAGTRLSELERLLAGEHQILGFEAACSGQASIGGAVACGLAGPSRPYRGAVRDFVLGVRVINGRGEALRFGGQVIKNVAGYDISRLFTGSWGTLGVITEVSLRVLPRPECEATLLLECEIEDALAQMKQFSAEALPLTGSAFSDGVLYTRLSGSEARVRAASARIGCDQVARGAAIWQSLADSRHDFFTSDTPIYRVSVPPATPHPPGQGKWLFDWGGALRWVTGCESESGLQDWASANQGVMFSWPANRADWIRTGDASIDRLQDRIRRAFDPFGVFS